MGSCYGNACFRAADMITAIQLIFTPVEIAGPLLIRRYCVSLKSTLGLAQLYTQSAALTLCHALLTCSFSGLLQVDSG